MDRSQVERYIRNKARLTRAFTRIIKRPRHASPLSPASIAALESDIRRVAKHAIKLGWAEAKVTLKPQ